MTEAFYLDILLASPKHCLRAVPPFNWEVSAASGRGWGGAWPATPVASLRELLTATGWGCYSLLSAAVFGSARAQTFGSTNRLLIFENCVPTVMIGGSSLGRWRANRLLAPDDRL
jgi:hypothetical protein